MSGRERLRLRQAPALEELSPISGRDRLHQAMDEKSGSALGRHRLSVKIKKYWHARHTGIKIAQQIAILLEYTVLPHPRSLVEIMEHGLSDENQKVRTIIALSLAALAETAAPYGIESFDSVPKPLWKGICPHHGKVSAPFLKAIGFIILLIDAQYSRPYKNEVMVILIREFQSSDEEMKKIVLKVVRHCVSTEGVEADYNILPEFFFQNFCVRRMALDRMGMASSLLSLLLKLQIRLEWLIFMEE
ncbi:hypothetical protein KSP40_PGU009026 [Platanthera guangdongensis]|uniref:Uncharacterized protein n=1 Tax=Platanthera guangdongensis TaxID=2320717 RepID=A0ABR2M5Q9_9ASPA